MATQYYSLLSSKEINLEIISSTSIRSDLKKDIIVQLQVIKLLAFKFFPPSAFKELLLPDPKPRWKLRKWMRKEKKTETWEEISNDPPRFSFWRWSFNNYLVCSFLSFFMFQHFYF